MSLAKATPELQADRLQAGTCRQRGMDPEWWTGTHHVQTDHVLCRHRLARHLCLVHCPVLAECAEDEPQWGSSWEGMVIAGTLRIRYRGRSIPARFQPGRPDHCPICTPTS